MIWLLNFIGILIFFINRFFKREDSSTSFDLKFWILDNFQEMSTTLLLNLAFMLLIQLAIKQNSIEVLFAKLPEWLTFLGLPGICFSLGAGLSWTLYELFQSKKNNIVPKP
jgi:hypothetical protein